MVNNILGRVNGLTKKLAPNDIAYILEARNDIGSSMNVDDRVKMAVQRLAEHPLLKDYTVEVYFRENKRKPEESNKFRLKAIDILNEEEKTKILGRSIKEGEMFYDLMNSEAVQARNYNHPFLKKIVNIHKLPLNNIGFLLLNTLNGDIIKPELKNFLNEYIRNDILLQIKHAVDYEQNFIAATRDRLTGLYNYQFFENSLIKESQEEMRKEKTKEGLSLIFFDLDNFKGYNDAYGHTRGDEVLKKIGGIITPKIRSSDVAARAKQGDEFAIILPNASIEDALRKAESIRNGIETYHFRDEDKIRKITASFGVANLPNHAINNAELIECADKAVYHSKNNGGNKVSIYDPSL